MPQGRREEGRGKEGRKERRKIGREIRKREGRKERRVGSKRGKEGERG